MKTLLVYFILLCVLLSKSVFAVEPTISDMSSERLSNREISPQMKSLMRRCEIDQDVVNAKMSSDSQAVIISGTSYVSVADIERCETGTRIHAKKAAPNAGFLSDVSLSAGIYVSMIPVAANPLRFVAVVAKLGSDRNMVSGPGYYGPGMTRSKLLYSASADMSPVLSVDARYVSLDLYDCEPDDGGHIFVMKIATDKMINMTRETCEKEFLPGLSSEMRSRPVKP